MCSEYLWNTSALYAFCCLADRRDVSNLQSVLSFAGVLFVAQ